MKNKSNNLSATIIMMRGLPGSGKSRIAAAVQKVLPARVVVLDPDAIDMTSLSYKAMSGELTKLGVDKKLHPYRFLRASAHQAIENGKIVLWNQAFTHQDLLDRTIKNLETHAQNTGFVPTTYVVEVQIEPDKARQRIEQRVLAGDHGVPDDVFARFVREYTTFEPYGYPIIPVSGEAASSESAQAIIEALHLT